MSENDPVEVEFEDKKTGFALLDRFLKWWRRPLPLDPWGEEIAMRMEEVDAIPVCHRCLEPQTVTCHFCPNCGTATGPYNNLMPFEQIFSIGEVLLRGVQPNTPRQAITTFGYTAVALCEYSLFGVIYLVRFFWRTLSSRSSLRRRQPPPAFDDFF